MKIWVDADACPVAIKEILFRAAERTKTMVTFVENQYIKTLSLKFITHIQVPRGFDIADNEIIKRSEKGDLVVTSDIPLADAVINKGCLALSPRGELFSTENIKSRLSIRDFMEMLRSNGIQTGAPSALTSSEKQAFGNHHDKWLVKKQRHA